MADVSLKLLLTGQDRSASKAVRGVGTEAERTATKTSKIGTAGKAAFGLMASGALVAGAAAVKFGSDSLTAFAEAETSQNQLSDAYQRFPALAKGNIEALREYNEQLQRKTGVDADDIAAGQAVLARYKLNETQLRAITPLLADYAARTGKTIPASATTLGKAIMGNAKAMKELGIKFKDTGDPAKNFDIIMDGLKEKVGGYSDQLPEAEKKQKILEASFGDLQEAIGSKLQPAMIKLIDAGQGVLDWLDQHPKAAKGASSAFDLLGMAAEGIITVLMALMPVFGFIGKGIASTIHGVGGLLEALGNVPGFEWAKDAATRVNEVGDAVDDVADGLIDLGDNPPPRVGVKDEATAKVRAIDTAIQSVKGKIVKAEAKGDDKGVRDLKKKLKALEDEKHNVDVNVEFKSAGKSITVGGRGLGVIKLTPRARGGVVRPGETTLLGEAGMEAVALPAGSRVIPATETLAALRGASLRGATSVVSSGPDRAVTNVSNITNIQIDVSGVLTEAQAGQKIEAALNKLVRDRGGKGFKAS